MADDASRPSTDTILRAHPELRCLVDLQNQGWVFQPVLRGGEMLALRAAVDRGPSTDALWFDGAEAVGVRVVDDGCVWLQHGRDLAEVVAQLVALPAHGEQGAPRLIIHADLASLW